MGVPARFGADGDFVPLCFQRPCEGYVGTGEGTYGDLGAGKTHFVKGLAKGLKYKNLVTSPTFTIMNVYEGGKCPIYHFDMYRIKNSQEAEILGFQDYFDKNQLDGISVIEWPENIPEMINEWNYKVIINKLENENHRLIEIQKRS